MLGLSRRPGRVWRSLVDAQLGAWGRQLVRTCLSSSPTPPPAAQRTGPNWLKKIDPLFARTFSPRAHWRNRKHAAARCFSLHPPPSSPTSSILGIASAGCRHASLHPNRNQRRVSRQPSLNWGRRPGPPSCCLQSGRHAIPSSPSPRRRRLPIPLWIPVLTRGCSYGLFKAADKKLLDSDNIQERLSTVEKINKE